MLVPDDIGGAGVGLSVLKRGWMCDSLTAGLGGLEMSRIIFGGGARAGESIPSDVSGNGTSSAQAGDAGRLPGMDSKAVPREGADCRAASLADSREPSLADCMTASLAQGSTSVVSHTSNPSAWETLSMDWASE